MNMNWLWIFGVMCFLPSCAQLAMKEVELIDDVIVEEITRNKVKK